MNHIDFEFPRHAAQDVGRVILLVLVVLLAVL